MYKDPTEFRARFKAYKEGKMPYENGLPKFAGGTPGLTSTQQAALDDMYNYFNPLGYDIISISGMGGNGLLESGLNPDIVSKSGYAGVWQNNKNLQNAIKDMYGDHSKDNLFRYANAWVNGDRLIRKGKHAAHTALGSGKFKKAGYKTAEEAADAWLKNYERAVILDSNGKVIGYQDQGKRKAFAKAAYNYLSGKYGKGLTAVVPEPIIEQAVSTAVRNTIPAEQTHTTWEGALNVSPYLTNKPLLILNPRITVPSVTEPPVLYNSWFENRRSNNIRKMMDNTLSLLFDDEDSNDLLYAKDGRLPKFGNGIKPKSRRARAMYNSIDPRSAYPEGYLDAAKMEAAVRAKMMFGDPDKLEYKLDDDIGSRVSDAAWRKRLGYDYDEKLLIPNGDKFRLPVDLENEIPTDTTMLKNRIKRTEELMKYSRKYRSNPYIKLAKLVDLEALEALRKTYKTGQPVTINEHAFNSRLWVSGGNVSPTMSPLNVLLNYTILYDKDTNSILYNDIYDFNLYDWAIPGSPFKIGGQIKVPQYKDGKSPIHIKPANRGKFTALKKRTGHSASWFKLNGTPAQKKMATFALNAKKWKH